MAVPRPPRLAGRLLDLLDPTGTVRGDLDEEYLRHRRAEVGRARADLWYWSQVVRSVPWLWRGRGSGEGRRVGPTVELGQAMRMLRRRPGPSLLIVLTLGLALGVNAAVFSLVQGIVLRPLPFENEERLVRIHPDELFYIDLAGALRVQESATSVERILPWGRSLFTLTGSDPAEELRGGAVAYHHFEALGTRPMLGRSFRLEDAQARPTDAVILAHGVWTRRFGADPTVIGRRIEVGGRSRTLVGVMGPDHVPMEPDWEAWAPLPDDPVVAAGNALALNALVRPGVPRETVASDIRTALVSAWADDGYEATEEEVSGIGIVSLRRHLLGGVRTPLLVLLGAVGFVLLLACASVANLLLAQGTVRRAEVAVRASLGASRARILGQLGAEVLVLALLGGAVGLLIAVALHEWASGRLPADLPRADQWSVDGPAVLYTLVASWAAALLAGILPAWKTAGGRRGARILRGEGDRNVGRISAALVALQVTLSVLLVVGAGLMTRSFLSLSAVSPGFEARGAVAIRIAPPSGRYDDGPSLAAYYDEVRQRILAGPGVDAAGGIMFLPMTPGGAWNAYRPEDRSDTGASVETTGLRIVTPGYFEAMGIPLRAGRVPEDGDGPGAVPVATINETLARHAFGETDPLGRRLILGSDGSDTVTVVGVVGDVRQADLRTDTHPELYRPLAQAPFQRLYMVARSSADATPAMDALQEAILAVDPDVVLSRGGPVEELVRRTMGDTVILTHLLGLFGLVAVLLGAIGIYGVTAHNVMVRRRETGIRLALGADTGEMSRRTLLTGLAPVLAGVVLGLATASGATRLLESLLFQVDPLDPVTFAMVPILFGLVALASLAGPTLRAGRTDPVDILRTE